MVKGWNFGNEVSAFFTFSKCFLKNVSHKVTGQSAYSSAIKLLHKPQKLLYVWLQNAVFVIYNVEGTYGCFIV